MKRIINFFEKPQNARKVRWAFFGILAFLIGLDLLAPKHPHFSWEALPGFYAVYGFVSCVLIVAVSKILGKLWLQKEEDYYT